LSAGVGGGGGIRRAPGCRHFPMEQAGGLVFLVLCSLYMWWQVPRNRLAGGVALALGSLVCGLLCLGLRWLL